MCGICGVVQLRGEPGPVIAPEGLDRMTDVMTHRGLNDRGRWLNQEVSFVKQLWNMLELARVITLGALARDESRGAHYKPDFPQRDDTRFLKTTKARWTSDGPLLSYEDVDASIIKPRARKYDVDKSVSA